MPEGPECRRITDKMRERVKGKYLTSLTWLPSTKYSEHFDLIWPQIQHMFPLKCLEILCRGKQIYFFFENNIAFKSSLGTEGHWYYFKAGQSNAYLSSRNYAKFCLFFGSQKKNDLFDLYIDEDEFWYDDMISYGNFAIMNWQGAFQQMAEIGPDLLATMHPLENIDSLVKQSMPPVLEVPVTPERYLSEIRSPRRGRMELCRFLMENKYISGIGNYLKCEVLYRARLHPNRVLGSLSDTEISTLYQVSLKTISEAYSYGGLTHGTFLDPDMQKGTFPIFVYKRKGELDPNGYVIQSIKTKDGRTTYFVPELQV